VDDNLKWTVLPDKGVAVQGLAWADTNWPHLWRLPDSAMSKMPRGVAGQALFAAGGVMRFITDSSQLHLKAESVSEYGGQGQGVDLYVDGTFWHTVPVTEAGESVISCYEGCERGPRDIMLYLPHRRELRISAIGMDTGATVSAPAAPPDSRPLVLYGSSVAQGAGASRPGMSYGNILARRLGVQLINLGFGGAGKAEPEVVDLVASIKASCFLLDLGKSYGMQPAAPYLEMLRHIRNAHPETPLICLTPIFSTREQHDPDYANLSRHTRDVVLEAVDTICGAGEANTVVVDGLRLLGPDDADGLSSDGVHPSDLGYERIARGLVESVSRAVGMAALVTGPTKGESA
jgi:hypothetical protein